MAEEKKSFIAYADWIKTVSKLKDNKAGQLFKIILEYVNDMNPVVDDLLLEIAFEPIKQQLKRDLKEWEFIKENRSDSGKLGNLKRWNNDLYVKVIAKEMTIKEAEIVAKDRKTSHPDRPRSQTVANVAVNGNVNVNDNVILYTPAEGEKSVEECLAFALKDEPWIRRNKTSESELKRFNEYLKDQGKYYYIPIEYKAYFHNLKKKNPEKLLPKENEMNGNKPSLSSIVKQIEHGIKG